VAGARRPVPLPSVSWRAPGLSPPLRHSVGRCDTLPLSSMARRRPAASDRRPGLGMRSAGARSLSPAGPPLCGPAAAGCRSRRCGAARPLLPLRDAATTSFRGGPARSRPGGAGEGGSSMVMRRPATGNRGWGCGLRARGISAPRAPPLCGPVAAASQSRRCSAARPFLPLHDTATTSGRGGPARSRPGGAGEGGSVGTPRHTAGRSWPD